MSAAVECIEGEDALPLRYGGPIDVISWRDGSYRDVDSSEVAEDSNNDNDDDEVYEGFLEYQSEEGSDHDIGIFDDEEEDYNDDSSFIWIHRNQNFSGERLGESGLWVVNEDDALLALQSGELLLEDVMIFAGVCIWEKCAGIGQCNGGIREQIDSLGSLEVVNKNNILMSSVWDILTKKQDILTKDTLDTNIKSAIEAWDACSDNQAESTKNSSKTKLADAALKAWVAINLLEEPVDTEVVIAADNV